LDHKTEQSRNHYNQIAHQYDESFEGRFTLAYNHFLCDTVTLKDNDSVLDVACGSGRLLQLLSKKARIHAYGIDVSQDMISSAKSNFKEAEFNVCSADKIGYPSGKFDLVTVCCAFHHFSEPEAFLKEAFRILKSNGKLVIADPSPCMLVRWIENLIIPFMKMGDVKIYGVNQLRQFFERAGFTDISCIKRNDMLMIQGTKP
jgi:ubiquinone/menaquinone biosynthesis C-methylase UbiE